jgi:glycine cleavage system aminomethyltransferase T
MAQASAQSLKRTTFHDIHLALGAKMVPFAGFEMPVQYPTGITAEHKAVRRACGLFDVSHMGEFVVRGPQAVEFVDFVTTNHVAKLEVGQVHYSTILNERGTIEDDCLVYRFEDHLMMVVNASNVVKDFDHISRHLDRFEATLENVSDDVALLALQGPEAAAILQPIADVDLDTIGYYRFATGSVAGVPEVTVSRTGYTGEDGFELYFDPEQATRIWQSLTGTGRVTPAGQRLPGVLRGGAERAGAQRDDEPLARDPDRHLLPPGGGGEGGDGLRDRDPGKADRRAGGEDAVLQGRVAPVNGEALREPRAAWGGEAGESGMVGRALPAHSAFRFRARGALRG